jgi:hypothetical protein
MNQRLYRPPLTTAEAAARIGWTPKTLANKRASGDPDQPAFYRAGRNVRYREEEVERYISSRTVTPGADPSSDRLQTF